jgi:hypothetical protein
VLLTRSRLASEFAIRGQEAIVEMFGPLESLRTAVAILQHGNGSVKTRLCDASAHFWVAMENPDAWPAHLLARANRIVDRILEGSSPGNPLKRMDERTARLVAREIIALAADMGAAQSGELVS